VKNLKIGVFSDSHDHLMNIRKVIDRFIEFKVDKIVHCGDMISPFIKRAMTALDPFPEIERIGVYGNNDGERAGLRKLLKNILEIQGDLHEIVWDGISIVIYHGTDARILNALIASKKYQLVLYGHTHQFRNEVIDEVLVVNPGETCGYLTEKATFAIIDLDKRPLSSQNVKIIDV
jgi:putative phosphoesterase